MSYFAEYGLFLAKVITFVVAIIVVVGVMVAAASKGKEKTKEKLIIKNLNEKYKHLKALLNEAILNKHQAKALHKKEKQIEKQKKKSEHEAAAKKRVYVIHFHGDIRASAVKNLREEITAVLTVATPQDEVVVCLESQGGMVHTYGLAASQLQRLKQHNIPLTVIVDKVAASGGYMMACVANQIVAAPFAIIGSIGVIAQLPNFNRLLKKNDIEYEQFMAGEYKRTVTLFGENTRKGREKFQQEIDETHLLFKKFITTNRPVLNIDAVATGEHWYGSQAFEFRLIDKIMTSDDYLLAASENSDIYELTYSIKKGPMSKLAAGVQTGIDYLFNLLGRHQENIL